MEMLANPRMVSTRTHFVSLLHWLLLEGSRAAWQTQTDTRMHTRIQRRRQRVPLQPESLYPSHSLFSYTS
eukprot:12422394-Karenia_brevis.AAC.1